MKFILALAPLASFSVLANSPTAESPLAYARPSKPVGTLKFSEEGIHNILKASAKNSKVDSETAVNSIKEFLDRNPTVIKSVMKVVNEPKYKAVKQDAMTKIMDLYTKSGGNINFRETGIKAINYVYDHPKLQKMLHEINTKLLDDHPNAVNTFFSAFDKLVKMYPNLTSAIKKETIRFSKDNEEAYYKVFEMVVKGFTIRPRVAARVAIHALEADQISCPGTGSSECTCNKETYPEVETEEPSTPEEPEVDGEEPATYEPEEPSTPEEPEVDSEEPETYEPEVETEEPSTPEEPEVDVEESVTYEPETKPDTEKAEVTYLRPQ